ncbi:GNAT family N-acetyltransferase [Amycolatopsis sp. CA-230715]|uniref:GNAT family N-acetyltransferase n=1 Tax=Amycolatopsis sp. CA-230715 TaxID=2745196 RepID=UPI001C021F91|nr:GNAT family N-acetyltransferase [Amycolatopsis sp. CA-230715]QWF82276.1 hypothetical protein HUW46_05713 [Amycolatopsis sp. CA-230715]
MPVTIRRVRESDVDAVVGMVHDLAEFEKAPQDCHLTAPQLHTALFGDSPALFGHIAEAGGQVVGFTLWFLNFSTWNGVHGIYLEDLYVRQQARGSGAGKALMTELAKLCAERGYSRLEWSVLNWNPAIEFYRSLGAVPMDEWSVYRLDGEPLRALAGEV